MLFFVKMPLWSLVHCFDLVKASRVPDSISRRSGGNFQFLLLVLIKLRIMLMVWPWIANSIPWKSTQGIRRICQILLYVWRSKHEQARLKFCMKFSSLNLRHLDRRHSCVTQTWSVVSANYYLSHWRQLWKDGGVSLWQFSFSQNQSLLRYELSDKAHEKDYDTNHEVDAHHGDV